MKKLYLLMTFMALLAMVSCSSLEDLDTPALSSDEDYLDMIYNRELNEEEPPPSEKVIKANPKKVYVHYMPWFHSKEVDNYWGQHWTMTNKNPDIIDENGRREIAAHYYPLIGPYSSYDSDLQEYHLLLMKISGIDGVIFDWYGSRNIHDYEALKINTESFIKEIEEVGLEFAIMYEDKVTAFKSRSKNAADYQIAARQDMNYIKDTYFTSDNYIRINNREMLFIFGPNYIVNGSDWDYIFQDFTTNPNLMTLWGASNRVGKFAYGEFSWVDVNHLGTLTYYYNQVMNQGIPLVGGSYPGFNDYYFEGGWRPTQDQDWEIKHNQTSTFIETLSLTHNYPAEFIQIITWNDFGEGTMIEPSVEFGYSLLREIQEYTGAPFTQEDLELPYRLYNIRKKALKDMRLQTILNQVYKLIYMLEFKEADKILSILEKKYGL